MIREALDRPWYETYREFVTSIYGNAAKASGAIYDFESLDELITQSGKKLEATEDRTKLICEARKEDPNFIQSTCTVDGVWAVYDGEVKVEMKLWEKMRNLHKGIRSEVEEVCEGTDGER